MAFEHIEMTFPDGTRAIDDVSFVVDAREFVTIVGPSGCGKSTLLRVIGDLVEPTTGEILVNGKQAHRARLDRDYGIVFQAAVLYDGDAVVGSGLITTASDT